MFKIIFFFFNKSWSGEGIMGLVRGKEKKGYGVFEILIIFRYLEVGWGESKCCF